MHGIVGHRQCLPEGIERNHEVEKDKRNHSAVVNLALRELRHIRSLALISHPFQCIDRKLSGPKFNVAPHFPSIRRRGLVLRRQKTNKAGYSDGLSIWETLQSCNLIPTC